MRLTIARKIALAVIAIVILCVGTMAWVTSANLQRGFINYLNEMQAQDLDQVRDLLAARYRKEGHFEWLRRQPRAFRDVLDQMQPRILTDFDAQGHRPPPRRHPGPPQYGQPFPPPSGNDRPPRPSDNDRPPPPPEGRSDAPPPYPGEVAPPPGQLRDGPPPGARDPMGFAARISIIDALGRTLMGPPEFPPGIERAIVVDGKTVATMRLRPLRQAAGTDASASGFLREQMRMILMLAALLIAASILLAAWLARHLLRPVAALRDVTARLARGELAARAPLLSRDELAELALHVNAMAEALEESEAQRRKMLADISHELRTPLTVIRGEIEALLDGIRKADPRALESLHGEVLRLNKLVDDLHQLTLADTGDLHFDWQPVALDALLLQLLERYQPRAAAAGLTLVWTLPANPLLIQGDPHRITQMVMNLLENSVRYTDAPGRIVVALSSGQGDAVLTVDDSAPGVPDGAHASIFERLYRVDGARTRERGGSGLGLSICKAMVEAHGGAIVALPSALGGVRMQIRLPLTSKRG